MTLLDFADGHVRLLSLRQTLTPVVLWDNIADWCPECACASKGGWTPADIAAALKMLDKNYYP